MRVHFAGLGTLKQELLSGKYKPQDMFALESFISMNDWYVDLIPQFRGFLLDSGAFTYMNGKKTDGVDWESYADRYADFIKAHGIRRYFELDIDAIVGLKNVERLRNRIEARSGVPSIPVWHLQRGKQYFLDMCKDYDYVAIGGLVAKKTAVSMDKYFPWFINKAHENGAQIHGLGFTKLEGLKLYHFDSVDSTTWNVGAKYGQVCIYNQGTIKKTASIEKGKKARRLKLTAKEINQVNFEAWLQFARYAENNL